MGSATPDSERQSASERMALGEAVALAGADILGGVGQLKTATVFSPVQAVLDNEAGAYLRALTTRPEIRDAATNRDELRRVAKGTTIRKPPGARRPGRQRANAPWP